MEHNIKLFVVLIILISQFSRIQAQEKLYEINKNLEVFLEVYKTLNEDFVDELDPNHLMKIGVDAMTKSLDPYTRYISESEVESYRMSMEGKYEGIGAMTKKIGEYITIVDLYEGSPAHLAGLKVGDQIVAINGQDTKGKSREDAKKIMRGVIGTAIEFEVKKYDGSFSTISMKRGDVSMENVPYSGMVAENVGYVILTTFTSNASKNVEKAIKKLKKANPTMDKLILDLRGNGGGLLREAIALVNVFVPKDLPIVSTKGKVFDRDKSYKTRVDPSFPDIPLIVLINGRSASASEIVSGSIQDLDRGVLMGQRSFGKGLVQNTKDLPYNSRLKLTTSKYYIPSGRCIQGVEYEDGKPKDIPDDQRNVFYTSKKREVLDGGGVTPDVKLEAKKQAPYVKALLDQHMIFNYVNGFVFDKDSISSVEDFAFSDFEGFSTFLQGSEFTFTSKVESILENLEKETNGSYLDEINRMKTKMEEEKIFALEKNKDNIIQLIEMEIVNRYYHQSGKAEVNLRWDDEIQQAILLLNDEEKYSSILNP